MNSNPILDANLKLISNYNPTSKYNILKIKELKNDIIVTNTSLQEPNLTYNEVPLHDVYGAELEAKRIFNKVENTPASMHVLFGFGLGYLFQQFALNSNGTVIVYEPNLEIIASTLEIADFTEELSRKNVFVCTNYQEFNECYKKNYFPEVNTIISFLPSYKKLFEQDLKKFASQVNLLMGSIIIDSNYIKNKLNSSVKSVCENIDASIHETPLTEFKNFYKEKTALIVSAGPTLDKNIEIIKKYRENVIIFCVGQATGSLMKNGITPDFIVSVELANTIQQFEKYDISDIDLIVEPITHREVHNARVRNVISYPSKTSVANLIWSQYANVDSSECVSSGTVSFTALYSAKLFGFKNIILVGQDLAYLDGKCYSSGAKIEGLEYQFNELTGEAKVVAKDFELFKNSLYPEGTTLTEEQKNLKAQRFLENRFKNLVFVDGIKGNKLITSIDYASFIAEFSNFAKNNNKDINLYNTSMEGALIEGFINKPLEDIIKDKEPVKRLDLKIDFKYDLKNIVENINTDIKNIEMILKSFKSADSLIESFDKEYNNRKTLTDNCLKYFKQILSMYIDLKESFSKKSRLYFYLQRSVELDLEYKLKISSCANAENIYDVYTSLKKYFVDTENWLNIIYNILKEKVQTLNEMLNSAS